MSGATGLAACKDPEHLRVVVVPSASARPAVLRDLRVTTGRVVETPGGRLLVTDPKMRFVTTGTPRSAEVRFTYRGPTSRTAALASGAIRRQLGLKLRARDGCNVVYAMWRLEPASQLVVSVKANEGASTHDECGVSGYENVAPSRRAPMPAISAGESHVLAATTDGRRMRVTVDTREVWEGALPASATSFDGPAGVRTDNVDVELDFYAGE